MRPLLKFSILNVVISFIYVGCVNLNPTALAPTPTRVSSQHGLNIVLESKSVTIWAAEADRQAAGDIFSAIEANSEQICSALQTECQFPLLVEIYPDQASFDKYAINPEIRGYLAISGPPHIIQMVSPANPAPHTIFYEDAVLVAVHEFTHLALDEVNAGMPTWLDEGTAIYVGPHQLYTNACQKAFPFPLIPSFHALEQDYGKIQAPDLFAYSVVDFIVSQYGMDKLNQLLRSPEKLETILGVSEEAFEDNWQNFVRTHYQNHQTKVFSNP